jgi:hypothetical protein
MTMGHPFVAGIYPLLLDETCFLLAVDFDKDGLRVPEILTPTFPEILAP